MSDKVVLYNFYSSSASWRVRIALAFKGIDYEYVSVNTKKEGGGEQHSEDYKKINPMAQIPSIHIDGIDLTQSLPIIEYIEERNPNSPLLPADKGDRAKVRALSEVINSGIHPLQNAFNKTDESLEVREANVRKYIMKGFTALESMLQKTAGRYSYGDNLTMADLFLVPQAYKAKRFGIDITQYPTISQVYEALIQLPAFIQADPSRQPDYPKKA